MSCDPAWITDYFERYREALFPCPVQDQLTAFHRICLRIRESGCKLIFAGNGASASIAAHGAVDFSKQGKLRAVCFNEANLLTAFSNDWGYENWVWRALDIYADPGDVAVLISSSGKSPNIVKAAEWCRARDMDVVTFTGFSEDNPLKLMGTLNFWINSRAYNIIENVHGIWLCTVVDMMVGSPEYGVV